jgi:hypothetical protein
MRLGLVAAASAVGAALWSAMFVLLSSPAVLSPTTR